MSIHESLEVKIMTVSALSRNDAFLILYLQNCNLYFIYYIDGYRIQIEYDVLYTKMFGIYPNMYNLLKIMYFNC